MKKILIIGANDNATAVALRLFRSGFSIVLMCPDVSKDLFHFRNYSLLSIIGSKTINGVKALTYSDFIYNQNESEKFTIENFVDFSTKNRRIPVLVESDRLKFSFSSFNVFIICDEELYKKVEISQIPSKIIICCLENNPGLADYTIFTEREYAGQVRYPFLDIPETEEKISGYHSVFSDYEGVFVADKSPGDQIKKGEQIALIDNRTVIAEYEGYLSGIIHNGTIIGKDTEVARIVEARNRHNPQIIPSKSFAIAGGVLEAILYNQNL